MSGGDGRTYWRGVLLDLRTAQMMTEVDRLVGPSVPVRPSQGSWSGAAASAGTHSGCGAVDLMNATHAQCDVIVEAMRRVGFAAWTRTPSQASWPLHVHGIAVQPGGKHDRGCLAPQAALQVVDYFEGRNGLAGGAPDDGPRDYVGVTWETYNSTGKDDDMTPEQAKMLGDINWAINQIRQTDLPPIRRNTDRLVHIHTKVDQIAWGVLDTAQGVRAMVGRLHADVRAIAAKVGATAARSVPVEEAPDPRG